MIHRPAPDGIYVITQPAHAWLSGQMVRAWGNDRFARPEPWEEVCLAAEQHDLAWADWELSPALNPATGLPHTVFDIPVEQHAAVWMGAGRRALVYGRYPALLISLHGTGFYKGTDRARLPPARRAYLEHEEAFQQALLEQLKADPAYTFAQDPERITEHRRLIGVADMLSLIVCMGQSARTLEKVPGQPGQPERLQLDPLGDDGARWRLTPWPFGVAPLVLSLEMRHLKGRFTDETEMHHALDSAAWIRATLTLEP